MADFLSSVGLRILQLGWTRLGSWWSYSDLSAPYWRFYWNDSPGAAIVVGKLHVSLSPERSFLIPPDTAFASVPPGEGSPKARHFYVHFAFEGVAPVVKEPLFVFNVEETASKKIREIIALHDEGEDFRAELLALGLLSDFLRLMPMKGLENLHEERVRKALEILKNHCERGISNTELASKLSMSTNAFIRLFKEKIGSSPQKYLKRLRIERACFMLHYTDKSIKEIAANFGFCDRYHFTKVFAELRGESPGAFRRKLYGAAALRPQ